MSYDVGTPYAALLAKVRTNLSEPAAAFWSDDDIMGYFTEGTKSLWRDILDLHAGHFSTIDNTSMSVQTNSSYVTGVPTDLFRILIIEPKDLSQSSQTRGVTFQPRKYNTIEFQGARGLTAKDPGQFPIIFYDVVSAGPPTNAPQIVIAPQVTSAILLNVQYVPVLPRLTINSSNPIPGPSDLALVAWATAYAYGKQPSSGGVAMPDATWLTIYKAERDHLMTLLTPRQEQEPEVVEGIYDYY